MWKNCIKCKKPFNALGTHTICPDCLNSFLGLSGLNISAYKPPLNTVAPLSSSILMQPSFSCAVCEQSSVEEVNQGLLGMNLSGSGGGSGRERIVNQIMLVLMQKGSFGVDGLEQFWNQYRGYVCLECQIKFDSIVENKRKAMSLLNEAIQLDSKNKAARENLAILKKII